MKIRRITELLFAILVLYSCEYELHDNYINLEEPAEVADFDINIYLDVESDGETIYLLENNEILFNIEVPTEYRFLRCVFTLDNRAILESGRQSGEFWLPGSNNQGRPSVLSCEVYVSSGTGSIADQLDSEYFYGTLNWPVEYITEPKPSLSYKINEEGFLELSWDKPSMIESNFICYKVFYNHVECADIYDINQLSYVFSPYYGGYGSFRVEAKIGEFMSWNLGSINLDGQINNIIYDRSDADSLIIRFDNPYKCSVSVDIEYGTIVSSSKDKTIRIPYNTFGSNPEVFNYQFYPYNEEDNPKIDIAVSTNFVSRSPGVYLGYYLFSNNKIVYNNTSNVLYFNANNKLSSWQLPEMVLNKEFENSIYTNGQLYSSVKDSKIAIDRYNSVVIMDGRDFRVLNEIEAGIDKHFIPPVTFTYDNKIICLRQHYSKIECMIYDVATYTLVSNFVLVDNVDTYPGYIYISPDSKFIYMYNFHNNDITIHRLEDYNVVETKKINTDCSNFFVNPLKSDQLFTIKEGAISKYNIYNQSVVKTLNYPGMTVGNMDSKTGNILLYGNDKIMIFDPEIAGIVYERQVYGYWFYLCGNTLISESGYMLNLDKYLSK